MGECFDSRLGAVEDLLMKLVIASDHAGFPLKEHLINQRRDIEWIDLGPHNTDSVDYPDYADHLAKKVIETGYKAILICGSGQGMCMRANKYSNIRAAMCWDTITTRLSREHNDANVLCLGGRLLPYGLVLDMIDVFTKTEFLGGRHEKRVQKIGAPTK